MYRFELHARALCAVKLMLFPDMFVINYNKLPRWVLGFNMRVQRLLHFINKGDAVAVLIFPDALHLYIHTILVYCTCTFRERSFELPPIHRNNTAMGIRGGQAVRCR